MAARPRRGRRTGVTTLIATLAAVAVLGVGAEMAARWWIRNRTRHHVWAPGLRLELRQPPQLFRDVEPVARFEINADGERGGPVRRGEPGLYRVLVAGGSAVECLALDQQTCWTGALEGRLNQAESLRGLGARRAHVGSIGRGGISSRHLDVVFEHLLPEYPRLSLIVVMVGGNDVVLWLEEGAPPELRPPTIGVEDVFPYHPEQEFGWTPGQTALVELARRLRQAWWHPLEIRRDAGAWVARARRMRAEARELRTEVPDPAVMLNGFEHHFRRLLRRAAAHADRVLVVRQPWFEPAGGDYTLEEAGHLWHGGLGKAWKQQISVYYAQEILNRLMCGVDTRAALVAEALGIEHLDLRPAVAPTLENYYDFVHYTPTGAAIVARQVAATVLRRPASVRPARRLLHADQRC